MSCHYNMIHNSDLAPPFSPADGSFGLFGVDYSHGSDADGWQRAMLRDGTGGQARVLQHAKPYRVMVLNVRLDFLCASDSLHSFSCGDSATATLLKLLVSSRHAPRRVKRKFEDGSERETMQGLCGPISACGYLLEALYSPTGDRIVGIRLIKMSLAKCPREMRDTLLFGRRIQYNQYLRSLALGTTPSAKRARVAIESSPDARVGSPPELLRVYQQYGGGLLFDTRALLAEARTQLAATELPSPGDKLADTAIQFHCLSPELLLGLNGGSKLVPDQGGPLRAGLEGVAVHPSQTSEKSYHNRSYFDVPDIAANSGLWALPFGLDPLSARLPKEVVDAIEQLDRIRAKKALDSGRRKKKTSHSKRDKPVARADCSMVAYKTMDAECNELKPKGGALGRCGLPLKLSTIR